MENEQTLDLDIELIPLPEGNQKEKPMVDEDYTPTLEGAE